MPSDHLSKTIRLEVEQYLQILLLIVAAVFIEYVCIRDFVKQG